MIEKRYGVKHNQLGITFLGKLNSEQIADKMVSSDLFVHPSHVDNSPNSISEAMMVGMPVIATNVGGIPSLIKNRGNGLLFQDGDSLDLASKILELSENKELSKRLGENARDTSLERHDKEKVIEDLLTVYRSLTA